MNDKGQLQVNENLEVVGLDGVFAVGDCNDLDVSRTCTCLNSTLVPSCKINFNLYLLSSNFEIFSSFLESALQGSLIYNRLRYTALKLKTAMKKIWLYCSIFSV